MIRAMVRLLVAVGFGAFIVLFALFPLGLRFGVDHPGWPESALMAWLGGLWPAVLLEGVLLSGAALIATWALLVQFKVYRFGFIPSSTEAGAYDWSNCKEPARQPGA